MQVIDTGFEGLRLIEPRVFADIRGHFLETFKRSVFIELGLEADFVQDSQSVSHSGVLRGMHWQIEPHAQTKCVRVARGRLLDVVIDLRQSSATFRQAYSVELSAENARMLWIPKGFAHGFLSLEDDTAFLYKVDSEYAPDHERGLRWDDPKVGIDWAFDDRGIDEPNLSPRDEELPFLDDLDSSDLS
jgi:dTDP-4-dehydrorhamnose 3,5-epimerase